MAIGNDCIIATKLVSYRDVDTFNVSRIKTLALYNDKIVIVLELVSPITTINVGCYCEIYPGGSGYPQLSKFNTYVLYHSDIKISEMADRLFNYRVSPAVLELSKFLEKDVPCVFK